MGPIAGFVVAVVAMIAGLQSSSYQPPPDSMSIGLGASPILIGLSMLILGPTPAGYILNLHPVAIAGWVGLLVTALNLLPIGQLDGGHVTYALFGRRHKLIGVVTVLTLGVLGIVAWSGWIVWGILGVIIGLRHPPVIDQDLPLTRRQRMIAWTSVVIFVLTFTPVPFVV
jgi:membrane-associated protease RseP (regulator of RpoE activity)